ncbi:ATP-binding protein [Tepidimonas sp.]|uniref:ATP-binding protein n=1 Tax=Tepidimonas sp. TaxID=2002775 RepID=UPI002FE0A279
MSAVLPGPSLRWCLLAATAVALGVALVVAGVVIAGLFRQHATAQADAQLLRHLDQVTAALEADADGLPRVVGALSDPRWTRPYGGLYWQVQPLSPGALPQRSRSLWDAVLPLPDDPLTDTELHRHDLTGPAAVPLRALERRVTVPGAHAPWRVVVAVDGRELEAAVGDFQRALAASLGVLGLALLGVAWVQIHVGLRPLRSLQSAVERVRAGTQPRLQGDFPAEVAPLVDDFNRVLAHDEQVVERSRRLAGNLAHAIKTPLAVMAGLADDPALPREALARQLREQVDAAGQQVDWHLRRARAASDGTPGHRTAVAPVLEGLLRVMGKVHAPRDDRQSLDLTLAPVAADLGFAGERQDLQEMEGNLLDNACKWASTRVAVAAERVDGRLCVRVDDDGPGLDPAQCEAVLQRGVRADERVPGAGLGLDIVREVAALYGGSLTLTRGPWGGLRAELRLPAA